MLVAECPSEQVTFRLGARVQAVRHDGAFHVEASGETITASALVIATGGLSIPKLGATSFAYNIARQFGLSVTRTKPGLVPFGMPAGEDTEALRELAGVSLPVRASIGKAAFSDALLFTHRGLSGPAMLQISSFWDAGVGVSVSLVPESDPVDVLKTLKRTRPRLSLANALAEMLPQRLARHMAAMAPRQDTLANMTDRDLSAVGETLRRWVVTPAHTEGYAKAEVTCGGIDTSGLSSQTMEAKSVPGLYFIGEAVDVTGWLGGYNFQWAWSSGFAAGRAALSHRA